MAGIASADMKCMDKGGEVEDHRGFTTNEPEIAVGLGGDHVIFARSGKFRADVRVTVPG